MNARSASTAPGSGTASGFALTTSSAVVRATPMVHVGAEAERPGVVHRLDARRHGAGNVRDHHELVDLLAQRGQRLLELARMTVRDDDGGDLHASTSR